MPVALRFLVDALELFFELIQVLVGKFLKIDKFIAGFGERANDLIQLQVDRFGVPVLCVLNQEHHQESDDGCASVDDELPGVREMKSRARYRPDRDDEQREK